jgi:hypothetical protein
MRKFSYCLLAAAVSAMPVPAFAAAVVTGFNSTALPANDDNFTGAISLGFAANYFGTTYNDTFVSNNGYITFGAGQGTFTPTGLGAGYTGPNPIIAAFFADVDTRNAMSGLTRYGTGTYDGQNAFGVTWADVGYFASKADKTNTFQLLMVDRSMSGAGNFDIVLNYDRILWETGEASGGVNGFGGASAAAGFNADQGNGAGTFFQLPGSLVNGALLDGGSNSLVANSNVGFAGRYVFQVRNGTVIVPGAVPEPATWAMMLLGFAFVGAALRRRKGNVTTTVSYA